LYQQKQITMENFIITQKAFNNISKRIEELTALRPYTFGYAHGDLINTIKALETKLDEISMELTTERYATQY
jgi:hypothetical protein